jgi:hypothetical protein
MNTYLVVLAMLAAFILGACAGFALMIRLCKCHARKRSEWERQRREAFEAALRG